jgi:aspartoacylase
MIIGSSMISKSFVKLVLLFLLSTSCYQCNVACFEPLPPVKRVVVVGGTHGNEYTGVWCIKAMHAQQEKIQKLYPSLQIETLLANEEAFLENKRFIDSDLNREFKSDTLCYIDDDEPDEIQIQDKEEEGLLASMESQRAKELDEILGSKCGDGSRDEIDVAIDLHSTTSNMGITLIINEGDNLMTQGAAYVAHQCDAKILIHSIPERDDRPTLSSAAKHGFTIEVRTSL